LIRGSREREGENVRLVKSIWLFALVAALMVAEAVLAQQTSSVQARLIVPDTRVLPGVPFDMWIEVQNPADTVVSVGLFPHLLVSIEGRDPFVITPQDDDYPILLKSSPSQGGQPIEYLTLAPGEKRVLTLPIRRSLIGAQFFADYRLSPPGRYTLAVRLDAFPQIAARTTPPLTFRGTVVTSSAVVDRIEPTGSDAKGWQRMQEVANGRWAITQITVAVTSGHPRSMSLEEAIKRGNVFAEILERYRDSSYVPYAMLAQAPFEEKQLDRVFEVIERFPTSPVVELLHLEAWMAARNNSSVYAREWKDVSQSKRPTTRIRIFGREDLPKEACPAEQDCED